MAKQSVEDDLSYTDNIKIYKENRRQKILRETAAVFAEHGLSQISMDKVAREIGVTKVVLYRYFKSKDELINTILAQFIDKITDSDRPDMKWGYRLISGNFAIIREHQSAFLIILRHTIHDPKYGHHYDKLCAVLVEHTVARLTSIAPPGEHTKISALFFSQRICNYIFDAIGGWISEGDASSDEAFLTWLVTSVNTLAYTWADTAEGR